jgi:hypothetical protein
MGLSFTIAVGPRQCSHSQVRVPQDSWPHLTIPESTLSQPGGPGPRIYMPQEQSDPLIPAGTGFHFLRLLPLAGLRWMYSKTPLCPVGPGYVTSVRTAQKTSRPILLRQYVSLRKRVYRAVAWQWPQLFILLVQLSAIMYVTILTKQEQQVEKKNSNWLSLLQTTSQKLARILEALINIDEKLAIWQTHNGKVSLHIVKASPNSWSWIVVLLSYGTRT